MCLMYFAMVRVLDLVDEPSHGTSKRHARPHVPFSTSLFGEHKDASKSQGDESFDRRPVHAVPPREPLARAIRTQR
jgi:hypothetical protein